MQQFAKANSEKNYEFDCKEEFELRLGKGYYVVVSDKGDSTLYIQQDSAQIEESRGKMPRLKQYDTDNYGDFIVTTNSFVPETAITNIFSDKLIMVYTQGKWEYSKPEIKVNELKGCEATTLEKKRSLMKH